MTTKRVIKIVTLLIFSIVSVNIYSQSDQGEKILNEGITAVQNSRFNQAISTFREILVDPELEEYQGGAYFWIAKSNMALGFLDEASEDLEYFLENFPENDYYSQARYQEGRIAFLKGNYEKAIQLFSSFIEQYPDSPYVANAYYWMGDSLLSLGHAENAKEMFEIVVSQYPTSYRVEGANYKISVIDLKKREDELVKLLKWSHEEALKAFEEFQQKEKNYQEAIQAYQKKIASLSEETETSGLVNSEETERLLSLTEELKSDISEKERIIAELKNRIDTLGQGSQTSETVPQAFPVSDSREKLLMLKNKALELKAFYLDKIAESESN
jgi:TolA-binding protein